MNTYDRSNSQGVMSILFIWVSDLSFMSERCYKCLKMWTSPRLDYSTVMCSDEWLCQCHNQWEKKRFSGMQVDTDDRRDSETQKQRSSRETVDGGTESSLLPGTPSSCLILMNSQQLFMSHTTERKRGMVVRGIVEVPRSPTGRGPSKRG